MPGKDVTTMNKVILMGRLTKNPEIKYAGKENDMAVARYTLAVNRRYKRDGEQEADFISCVTFGKSAEFAQKYLYKGMRIVIGGRISTGSYKDKDGKTIYTTICLIKMWRLFMSVSYNRLWKQLIDKNMKRIEMQHLTGISGNILARMGKNQYVSMETIEKICKKLDCTVDEMMEFTDDE